MSSRVPILKLRGKLGNVVDLDVRLLTKARMSISALLDEEWKLGSGRSQDEEKRMSWPKRSHKVVDFKRTQSTRCRHHARDQQQT